MSGELQCLNVFLETGSPYGNEVLRERRMMWLPEDYFSFSSSGITAYDTKRDRGVQARR